MMVLYFPVSDLTHLLTSLILVPPTQVSDSYSPRLISHASFSDPLFLSLLLHFFPPSPPNF